MDTDQFRSQLIETLEGLPELTVSTPTRVTLAAVNTLRSVLLAMVKGPEDDPELAEEQEEAPVPQP